MSQGKNRPACRTIIVQRTNCQEKYNSGQLFAVLKPAQTRFKLDDTLYPTIYEPFPNGIILQRFHKLPTTGQQSVLLGVVFTFETRAQKLISKFIKNKRHK